MEKNRQQRLAGARRADQQRALGQLCADGGVFLGIVEEIDDLYQGFLGLILSGDVRKRDAGLLFHIDLGLALAHGAEAAHVAHALRDGAHQQGAEEVHARDGQHPVDQNGDKG